MKQTTNNIKLGVFVLAGLLFLILLLYMIGRNRNLFGRNYVLKARFENVQGLIPGNNVRFAGIQAGTVKKIQILNDTMIEVTMFIDVDMKSVIRKNAVASIGTDGLVGNRVVNIVPSKANAALAMDGDLIASKKMLNTDAMLDVLNKTNNDVSILAMELKETVQRINKSTAVWALLNDHSIPQHLRESLVNIKTATAKAGDFANELNNIIHGVQQGKGTVGALLADTVMQYQLKEAVAKINRVSRDADSLTNDLNTMIAGIQQDIQGGNGTLHALLKDSAIVVKLHTSLDNIQKGTDGFNKNMEALKHNFLLRSYYRKMEREKKKHH
ncbi:MAG TPA: MlaD family protein [Lacibacter sp.]|nr:MlaD family protein [Lacibacter sp.]